MLSFGQFVEAYEDMKKKFPGWTPTPMAHRTVKWMYHPKHVISKRNSGDNRLHHAGMHQAYAEKHDGVPEYDSFTKGESYVKGDTAHIFEHPNRSYPERKQVTDLDKVTAHMKRKYKLKHVQWHPHQTDAHDAVFHPERLVKR